MVGANLRLPVAAMLTGDAPQVLAALDVRR